jgi:hypothetical protein
MTNLKQKRLKRKGKMHSNTFKTASGDSWDVLEAITVGSFWLKVYETFG